MSLSDVKDVTPELIDEIEKRLKEKRERDPTLHQLYQAVKEGKADYKTAHAFSVRLGNLLASSLQESLSGDVLPDGRMYYNIAHRIFNRFLRGNHKEIADFTSDVQRVLNEAAGIKVKVQRVSVNKDRIDGFINRISSEVEFDKVKWMLGDPVVVFSQSIVDDFVEANASFHAKIGLRAIIIRESVGNCCDWCQKIVGTFEYGDEPKDVYHRHANCRCTTEYIPKKGHQAHNVWTKQSRELPRMSDREEYARIVKILGDKTPVTLPKFVEMKYNDINKYERLLSKVHYTEKTESGQWGKVINPEKQADHMESTRKEGKSYLYDTVDPQYLYDTYAGTGVFERLLNGGFNNKEVIYLPYPIGVAVSKEKVVVTNVIKIHHSKNRVHIVPKEDN